MRENSQVNSVTVGSYSLSPSPGHFFLHEAIKVDMSFHLSKSVECTILRVNLNVNYGFGGDNNVSVEAHQL